MDEGDRKLLSVEDMERKREELRTEIETRWEQGGTEGKSETKNVFLSWMEGGRFGIIKGRE